MNDSPVASQRNQRLGRRRLPDEGAELGGSKIAPAFFRCERIVDKYRCVSTTYPFKPVGFLAHRAGLATTHRRASAGDRPCCSSRGLHAGGPRWHWHDISFSCRRNISKKWHEKYLQKVAAAFFAF